jgi:cadmium resistance protein CadD (predicted permease)
MSNEGPAIWMGLLGILFFLPAIWIRTAWSGVGFSNSKLLIAAIYNLLLIFIHVKISRDAEIPFLGTLECTIPVWLTFFFVIGHGCCVPSYDEKNHLRLGIKKKSQHSMDPGLKPKHTSLFDRCLYAIKNVAIVSCCSVSATAISVSALGYILTLSTQDWRALSLIILVFFIIIGIVLVHSDRRSKPGPRA